ncbi:TRAP transporter small permease subunit [Vannielia litorea]|uniref:TRAP transporter small permease protein n=1 Tax=Vannielia litorea TaxID=1217970 RepID=A0A1N6IDB9_9RHOB|nr:TRAP transporter small permease [Vannielia litorea]SIO30012.1 TRAP-type mannitol/chloroaromatic compound transport system, small permease component [Vannielia litorea]
MAGSSSVLEDGSTLSRIDRALFRVETVLALFGGLAVFGLMLLAVASVGGRNFFNQPLRGYVDWIQFAMPFIAILGVSYCHRLGGHIRMDILVGRLRGRALWLFELLSTLLVLALMILLLWGSWAHFGRSFDLGRPLWSADSSIDIGLPLWPAKLVVPVAFGVLCLRLVIHVIGYARAFATGVERPVAVPLIEDAAAQAAHEAEAVSGFEEDAR